MEGIAVCCSRCGSYFQSRNWVGTEFCRSCRALDRSEEVSHAIYVRCPACGLCWDVWGSDVPTEILDEGSHSIICPDCSHVFEVVTSIRYEFLSPERTDVNK